MKKLLLLILCATFVAACEKEEEPTESQPIKEHVMELGPNFGQPTR